MRGRAAELPPLNGCRPLLPAATAGSLSLLPTRRSRQAAAAQHAAMPVSAPAFGAVLGVGIQLYVNAVRKLPLMRDPWLHVLWAGAGASFGTWLVDFEERTEKDLAGACGRGAARGLRGCKWGQVPGLCASGSSGRAAH